MRSFISFIILLAFIAFPFFLQAQEMSRYDSIRIQIPEMPKNLNMRQFETNRQQNTTSLLYNPLTPILPVQYQMRTFSEFNRTVPLPANVNVTGFGNDFYNRSSRTALFSVGATPNLMFYSAATLGVHKTLPFGNINYYNIDTGVAFMLNHALSGSAGAFYRSALEFPMPITGTYLNMHFQATDNIELFGSGTFQNVQLNPFNVNQQSLMLEGRLRYRFSDDWYANMYGGAPVYENSGRAGMPMNPMMRTYYGSSAEYWFNETTGVEGGVIWIRDAFSGRMRAQPKFELMFRPKRR
jgi:hypothetical protein